MKYKNEISKCFLDEKEEKNLSKVLFLPQREGQVICILEEGFKMKYNKGDKMKYNKMKYNKVMALETT